MVFLAFTLYRSSHSKSLSCCYNTYSLRMSLSTVLFPAPMPPPMRRRTGLLSLRAAGTITSVQCESSREAIPIAFISSNSVENTLVTFRFLVILSNLCFLWHPAQNKKSTSSFSVTWETYIHVYFAFILLGVKQGKLCRGFHNGPLTDTILNSMHRDLLTILISFYSIESNERRRGKKYPPGSCHDHDFELLCGFWINTQNLK